jgi:uncharacterized caspase-like protein
VRLLICILSLILPGIALAQNAPAPQRRVALVIGNANYPGGALATAANDAGLIAQTLEAAGFDVVGARDLDQDNLRRSFRDFLEKARSSGPNSVAFIYLSGYGLQLEGENYFVPIDARISQPADVVAQAIRVSDYVRPLAALGLGATVVVLDVARPYPFQTASIQVAGGLALTEPEAGVLFAYSAAPDTVAPDAIGSYGAYAQALAEMMREGGLPINDVFDRVRLRVNEITKGGQIPWHSSHIDTAFVLFERSAEAPPPPIAIEERATYRRRPIRDFAADEAYIAALDRDTISAYIEFLDAYPDHPMARRVRAIVAARREAITWHRTRNIDTPEAYWSYLDRYPRGRHAPEARSRLAYLRALLGPPPTFTVVDYDVPPPPPEEYVYIERRVLVFDDPVFAFAPPPPPPIFFLAPPPPYFILPPPPPVAIFAFALPIPIYQPVPVWVRPPVFVAPPPPNNIIFNNIHNTVVINNTTNIVTITNPQGQTTTLKPQPVTSTGTPNAGVASIGPSLPPSMAQKASLPQPNPASGPGQPPSGAAITPPVGQPLPGTKGLPLPVAVPIPKSPTSPNALVPNTKQPLAKASPPAMQPLIGQPNLKQAAPTPPPGSPLNKTNLPPSNGAVAGTPLAAQINTPKPLVARPQETMTPNSKGSTPRQSQLPPSTKARPDSAKGAALELQREQLRQRQIEQQRQQELQRQRQAEAQRQREQQRQREAVEQRRGVEQQRQQELQRQRQAEAQRQREQQRQREAVEQRRDVEQQRQQELQRQRQADAQRQREQQRQSEAVEQRRGVEQQRQQELQRQRQADAQRQREQQRQLDLQRQQQRQQQPKPSAPRMDCGHPGQPACPR